MNTANEIRLGIAIKNAQLGGGDFNDDFMQREAVIAIFREWVHLGNNSVFPFTIEQVLKFRMNHRKNKNTRTKMQVAEKFGIQCFWAGRGKGECSEKLDCGHVVSRHSGGDMVVENCFLECAAHNRQRGVMSIEDYMKSGKTADSLSAKISPADLLKPAQVGR